VTVEDLRQLVRTIPDFPKPGILFRDVTTLMATAPASQRRWATWRTVPKRRAPR
jgi:adenine/guanine phosphoribosyltransferase-like PRPP-binding protein